MILLCGSGVSREARQLSNKGFLQNDQARVVSEYQLRGLRRSYKSRCYCEPSTRKYFSFFPDPTRKQPSSIFRSSA